MDSKQTTEPIRSAGDRGDLAALSILLESIYRKSVNQHSSFEGFPSKPKPEENNRQIYNYRNCNHLNEPNLEEERPLHKTRKTLKHNSKFPLHASNPSSSSSTFTHLPHSITLSPSIEKKTHDPYSFKREFLTTASSSPNNSTIRKPCRNSTALPFRRLSIVSSNPRKKSSTFSPSTPQINLINRSFYDSDIVSRETKPKPSSVTKKSPCTITANTEILVPHFKTVTSPVRVRPGLKGRKTSFADITASDNQGMEDYVQQWWCC